MNELLSLDLSNVGFASLFVWLLFYVIKTNEKRETKYQDTIEKLSTNLGIVQEIKEDLEIIKNKKDGVKNE